MSVLRKEDDALKAILVHLKNAVEKNEGIPITRLQGILSRLPPKARGNFSASPATIRLVTRKFPGTIFVDTDDKVYSCVDLDEPPTTEPPSKSTSGREEDEIIELCNVHGTVQYLAPSNLYGFIMVNYPLKANIFFDRKATEGGKHKDLRKSKVKVGSTVLLSAVRSPVGHKAKYQATCVECYDGATVAMPADSQSSPEPSSQSSDGEMIFNRTGLIQSIKFNHGFITFGPEQQLCAFFHRDKVKRGLLKPHQKLSDVFAPGDAVCFNARPSSRSTKSVKWQATLVTKVVEHHEPSQHDDTEDDDDDDGDEVFMSGDESEIAELLEGYEREDVVDGDAGRCAVGHADWEASGRRHPEPSNTELCTGYSGGRKLVGTEGTLYPDSATTALVFCLGLDAALVVEIGVVYHQGRQIKSFNDLLSNSSIEGAAEVLVDAVEVASDVWAATLVWTGDRPLRHYMEDVPNFTVDAARLGRLGREPGGRDGICIFSSDPEADCSVVAYQAARGTVLRVEQCSAVCAVQEPRRLRRIDFTCFYRNGTAYYRNLDQVLREGAAVSVNYMVGVADDGNEKVYCGLVWQGLTPLCVDQLSREEFFQMLNIIDAQPDVPSTATACDVPQEVQSGGNAVHGGHPGTDSAVAAVGKQAAGFDLPSSVAPASPSPLFVPTKSTAPGKEWASAWGKQRVQNVSVDEGSTSRVESSPMLTDPTVPSVPAPSRAGPSSVQTVPAVQPVPAYDKVDATAAAKGINTMGAQNGEESWKVELTDDCFSMDEEITMEELNELFEEDDEAVMLGCEGGWRDREKEEVTPSDPTQSEGKEVQGWTSRLDAGAAAGKVDVGERAGQAAAHRGGGDMEISKLESNIPESVSMGLDEEMTAKETAQAPEASLQQESGTPERDVVLQQQSSNAPEEEAEAEQPSATVVEEEILRGTYTLTGEMLIRLIGVIGQEVRTQLQDFVPKTVLEAVQKMLSERRDAETQVDGGGPSCASRPA